VGDVREMRRKKLELLRSQRRETWKELAKALKYSSGSYLTQLMKGDRPFGEDVAREFETRLGLRQGWFDEDSSQTEQPVAIDLVADVATTVIKVTSSDKRLKLNDTQLRRIVSMAYVQATKSGKVDEDYIKQLAALAGSG
jgi:hypothetical protein